MGDGEHELAGIFRWKKSGCEPEDDAQVSLPHGAYPWLQTLADSTQALSWWPQAIVGTAFATMIYTHVLNRGACGVRSPLDR
jgi:hypothetical protein